MYIIGPVRTAHFGRCRSFPNRFRIRRKAAADLGGGYFFRSTPNLIAAITSISNAMVSAVLMRSPPFTGEQPYRSYWRTLSYTIRLALSIFRAARRAAFIMFAPHPLFYKERVRSPVGPAGGLTSGFALIRKGERAAAPSPLHPYLVRGTVTTPLADVPGGDSRCRCSSPMFWCISSKTATLCSRSITHLTR